MHDLRRMGATNVLVERRKTPLRRATLVRMAEVYAERFADPDGRIRATFEIVWLSGWAPHESQQQPLKPGSAKASLEQAVKSEAVTIDFHAVIAGLDPAIHPFRRRCGSRGSSPRMTPR